MPYFLTPNMIGLSTLSILTAIGLVTILRRFLLIHRHGKKFSILELEKDLKNIEKSLRATSLPAVFEVAINQIGDTPKYYLAVPSSNAEGIAKTLHAKIVDDYELYYTNGEHIGAYLKNDVSFSDFDIDSIDFSEVNEVGEGAVVQFILNKKQGEQFEANARVLVSAPSPYQAKEIMSSIKTSLKGFDFVQVKNNDFMQLVDSRRFDPKESIMITL